MEKNGKPYLKKGKVAISPEEVSGRLLTYVLSYVKKFLRGQQAKRAVITVPAYFRDSQREATKKAAEIAGIEEVWILNEPTAAGIAFNRGYSAAIKPEESKIIVYDFGGGTFDVSLLSVEDGVVEVMSTSGDTNLGGHDVDVLIAEHLIKLF